jgi:hypothetical protein
MDFDALGEEAFAAPLAASGESRATGLGAHSGTEPVLVFPCAFGALEGAFHREIRGSAEWSGKVREGMGVVNLGDLTVVS